MSIENFTDLFDYLDETMDECDDELSLTRQFLMENKLPIDEVIEWNTAYESCAPL